MNTETITGRQAIRAWTQWRRWAMGGTGTGQWPPAGWLGRGGAPTTRTGIGGWPPVANNSGKAEQ